MKGQRHRPPPEAELSQRITLSDESTQAIEPGFMARPK